MERRTFIKNTSIITTGLIINTTMANEKNAKKYLLHHVFFWLKNPESVADRDKLVEGVKTLKGIPTIKQLNVGVLASTEKRDVVDTSWAVSELMFFEDEAGQKVYQDHPIHMEFIKNYSHLWDKVVVYDAKDV